MQYFPHQIIQRPLVEVGLRLQESMNLRMHLDRRQLNKLKAHDRRSNSHMRFDRRGQRDIAPLNGNKVGPKGLDSQSAGVAPVAVSDFSQKGFSYRVALPPADGGRDSSPTARPGSAQIPDNKSNDSFHAGNSNPALGRMSTPITPTLGFIFEHGSRKILAANFRALRKAHPALRRLPDIIKAGGGTNGTLDRVTRGTTAVSVDVVERLAAVYGLEAWQLLLPELAS